MPKKSGFIRDSRNFKMARTVKISNKNWVKNNQKPTATAFCINMHNSIKYAICMHKTNKTLEKGYKYTPPTFHYTHPFRLISVIRGRPNKVKNGLKTHILY